MRKYLLIILAAIGLLEIFSIIVYMDELKAYAACSVAGIGNGLGVLAIYVIGFILIFRALLR